MRRSEGHVEGSGGSAWPAEVARWAAHSSIARARQRRLREDSLRETLPEAVDLMRLAIASGLNPRLAIAAVARHGNGPVADTLADVDRRVSQGASLADELLRVRDELGGQLDGLISVTRAATLDGVPLGPALERLSFELRADRRRHSEAVARRLPVRMIFPLVCCALPALVLLAIVPLMVGTLRAMHP